MTYLPEPDPIEAARVLRIAADWIEDKQIRPPAHSIIEFMASSGETLVSALNHAIGPFPYRDPHGDLGPVTPGSPEDLADRPWDDAIARHPATWALVLRVGGINRFEDLPPVFDSAEILDRVSYWESEEHRVGPEAAALLRDVAAEQERLAAS